MLFSKRKLITLLLLFCVVFLVFFFSSREFTYCVRQFVSDVSKIPLYCVYGVTHEVRAVLFFHRSYWNNIKLLKENQELKNGLLNTELLFTENEHLRGLLDLKSRTLYKTQAALVIGKDFNSLKSYLLLDKGSSSGVKKYAAVFNPFGLVGKVLEVGRYSSKVILINDPDLSVPAVVVRMREQGIVCGTLDGRCNLRFLDIDSDVAEGDIVVTSGLNMTYPEGILIGKVKFVGVESSGLSKFAIVEPAVGISSVSEVLIATP